mmetsp:Transcript_139300/g.277791  ORF Transcript_139300/g.277791 Transcript_139300/m.277791 type:complete len:391 (-) Transcript_139300:97-1269(-)
MASDPSDRFFWYAFLLGTLAISGFFYPTTRLCWHLGHWYIGTVVGTISTCIFWIALHPTAAKKGMKETVEQGGGIGDLFGFVVTFVVMHLLYEENMFDGNNPLAFDQQRRFFLGVILCLVFPPFMYVVMVPWTKAYSALGFLCGFLCISSIWLAHGLQRRVHGNYCIGGGWGLFTIGALTFWAWLVPWTDRVEGNQRKDQLIGLGWLGDIVGIVYGGVTYHITADPNIVEAISFGTVALAMVILFCLRIQSEHPLSWSQTTAPAVAAAAAAPSADEERADVPAPVTSSEIPRVVVATIVADGASEAAEENPTAEAEGNNLARSQGDYPPLHEIVSKVREHLDISEANLPLALATACEQLGINKDGLSLLDQGHRCWDSLFGRPTSTMSLS